MQSNNKYIKLTCRFACKIVNTLYTARPLEWYFLYILREEYYRKVNLEIILCNNTNST